MRERCRLAPPGANVGTSEKRDNNDDKREKLPAVMKDKSLSKEEKVNSMQEIKRRRWRRTDQTRDGQDGRRFEAALSRSDAGEG